MPTTTATGEMARCVMLSETELTTVIGPAETSTFARVWHAPGCPRPPTVVAKFKVPLPPSAATGLKVQVKLTELPTSTFRAIAGFGPVMLLVPAAPVGLGLRPRTLGLMDTAVADPVLVTVRMTVPACPEAIVPPGITLKTALNCGDPSKE